MTDPDRRHILAPPNGQSAATAKAKIGGNMKNKVLIALGVVSLLVISMSLFAHHGTQISYDMNKAFDTTILELP